MIDFTRAFDSAWERMTIILFRPFDLAKWLAIGLSAFLAGLMHGGNGFNSSFRSNNFQPGKFQANIGSSNFGTQAPDLHQLNTQISHAFSGMAGGMLIAVILGASLAVVAMVLLFLWLGARGQFMFLDNVVRNRGAIAWPWNFYARQANSLFAFYLLLSVLSVVLILPILLAAIVLAFPLFQQSRWPAGTEITGFVVLGLIYLVVGIVVGVILFVFREFGIPIMFRQGLLARPAFFAAMRLMQRHPGSMALYILVRIALVIGLVIISIMICCVTFCFCCIGQWPYIGTLFLLPVLVFVRCFSLDCLAQFGPEYDAWTVDVAPGQSAPGIPPVSPPPPLG